MARPADRREFLETFLWLVDRNRPAREFRFKLGLKTPALAKAIKNIAGMRQELQDIYDWDKQKKAAPVKAAPTKPLPKPKPLRALPKPKAESEPKPKPAGKMQRKNMGENYAEKPDNLFKPVSPKIKPVLPPIGEVKIDDSWREKSKRNKKEKNESASEPE